MINVTVNNKNKSVKFKDLEDGQPFIINDLKNKFYYYIKTEKSVINSIVFQAVEFNTNQPSNVRIVSIDDDRMCTPLNVDINFYQ